MGNSLHYCNGGNEPNGIGILTCGGFAGGLERKQIGRPSNWFSYPNKNSNMSTASIAPVIMVQPLKVNTLVHNLKKVPMPPTSLETKSPVESINSAESEETIDEQAQDIHAKTMTTGDREIIAKCWRMYIQTGRRDIFHKTMLFCIEASPKLNEIIACQRYCFRDLTKWPKLDRICKAQFNFFERLIYELNMDEGKMREACTRLGQTHANYAQYGMKAHFLDIYHQQLLGLISNLPFSNASERQESVRAFNKFISFIIDHMNQAYSQVASEKRCKRPSRIFTEF